jgi:hypothetical protein
MSTLDIGGAFRKNIRIDKMRAEGASFTGRWARQESNLHATGYEPAALSVELRARDRHRLLRPVA